jgi:translation initiation factor 3 subunit E
MVAAAEYDLTATLALFLDPHLTVPLLDFLAGNGVHPAAEVDREKLRVLEGTSMIDTAAELYAQVHGKPAPAAMTERRAGVVARLEQLRADCAPLLAALTDAELVAGLQAEKIFHVPYLTQHHGATPANIEALYPLARAEYDCGNYEGAAELLGHYRALGTDQERVFHSSWGRLAALTLAQNWDGALREVERVREALETRGSRFGMLQQQQQQQADAAAAAAQAAEDAGADPAEAAAAAEAAEEASAAAAAVHPALIVEQRAWLLHWALFVFFNHPNGRVSLVDLFLQEPYAACITQTAPHLFRYLAVACVTEPRRRQSLRDVIRLAGLDDSDGNCGCGSTAPEGAGGPAEQDPVLRLLNLACSAFDLPGACALLPQCDALIAADFFLVGLRDEFAEAARGVAFEHHCRVNGRVAIAQVAATLGVGVAGAAAGGAGGDAAGPAAPEAERWVVDMIRGARLDARIDAQRGEVVMGRHAQSVYQTVVERTKGLSFRSATIGNFIAKRMAEVAATEGAAAAAAEAIPVGGVEPE